MDADGGGEFIADYYHPPSKTIGSDTLYFRIFRKHVDLSFLSIIGSRLLADLALTSRDTCFSRHLQPQHQHRAHQLLLRCFIWHWQHGEGKINVRNHVLSLWGAICFSARISCDNSKHAEFCFYRGREATLVEANTSPSGSWGCATGSWMRRKFVIDHVSTQS